MSESNHTPLAVLLEQARGPWVGPPVLSLRKADEQVPG